MEASQPCWGERVLGGLRPGKWTLGSGWGRRALISPGAVCLPGFDGWQSGGRACPKQWPNPAWSAPQGRERPGQLRGGGRGRADSLGCDAALPSASFLDVAACPGSLDCALKRRARCPPGARVCGPCLLPFREDHQGLCVPRTRQPPGAGEQGGLSPSPTLTGPPHLSSLVLGALEWPGGPFQVAQAQSLEVG